MSQAIQTAMIIDNFNSQLERVKLALDVHKSSEWVIVTKHGLTVCPVASAPVSIFYAPTMTKNEAHKLAAKLRDFHGNQCEAIPYSEALTLHEKDLRKGIAQLMSDTDES